MIPEIQREEDPIMESHDWQTIAREIWDELDLLALYLEDYMSSKNGCQFPFLEKMLPRRLKYFRNYRGRTLTVSEYDIQKKRDEVMMESLFRTSNSISQAKDSTL